MDGTINMKKITKKEFKEMHKGLSLLQGSVFLSKNECLEKLKAVPDIKKYCLPVSNHGNISTDKTGIQTTDIYQHDKFIFVETIIDNSKNPDTSRNNIETFNTIYYKG